MTLSIEQLERILPTRPIFAPYPPIRRLKVTESVSQYRTRKCREWIDFCLPVVHIYVPILVCDELENIRYYTWKAMPPQPTIKVGDRIYRVQYYFWKNNKIKQIGHIVYAPDGIVVEKTRRIH